MTISVPTKAQLEQMSRDAKKLSREESISHTAALDRLAQQRGYKNWSLLAKAANQVQAMPLGADAAPRMTRRERAAKGAWLLKGVPRSALAKMMGHKAVRATDYYAPPTLTPSTLNDMRAVFKYQFERQLMDASSQATTQAGRAKALEEVQASGEVPISALKTHAESASTIMARNYSPTAEPAAPTPTDAAVRPGEAEDD